MHEHAAKQFKFLYKGAYAIFYKERNNFHCALYAHAVEISIVNNGNCKQFPLRIFVNT